METVYFAYRGGRLLYSMYSMYTATNDARWVFGTGMWLYDNCRRALSSSEPPIDPADTDEDGEWQVVSHPEVELGGPLKLSG